MEVVVTVHLILYHRNYSQSEANIKNRLNAKLIEIEKSQELIIAECTPIGGNTVMHSLQGTKFTQYYIIIRYSYKIC